MKSERLDKILDQFRKELLEILKEEILKNGGRKEIHLELLNDWDEDRYDMATISEIFIENDELRVVVAHSLDGETDYEELDQYDFDDIIEIIHQL